MTLHQPIAITGMGIVSSIGHCINEFNMSLKRGRCGISFLENKSDVAISVKIGAEIKNFSYNSNLEKNATIKRDIIDKARHCALRSPRSIQISVVAALEAWKEAGLNECQVDPERMGIIIAGNNLTQNYNYSLRSKFADAPEYLNPRYALHFFDTDHVGTLSDIFKIKGEGFTVGGASASGNVGIIKASQLINLGIIDVCMVVGAMADISPMELQGFYNIGAMGGKRFQNQPEKSCRPFDKDHEGFIYGQSAGCLILESAESVIRRHAIAHAEILGGVLLLDGNRLSDSNEEGETRVMQAALKYSNNNIDQVDYINTHGSSSPLGDKVELKAIRNVFQDDVSRIWLNSTKSLTGHCLYSAGIIETIASVLQMENGYIHPNLNLDNPIDSECRLNGLKSVEADINIAMNNSFGFGGINSSIIIRKGHKNGSRN